MTTNPTSDKDTVSKLQANSRFSGLVNGCPTYDPELVDRILTFQTFRQDFQLWWESVQRFFEIFGFFLQILWMVWWDSQIWSYIGEEDIDRAQSLRRHDHGRKITEKLLYLGPTFIKVGQSLSTRVDLIRKEYIEELSELQDKVPMFPVAQARRIIEEELGAAPEELFETFHANPIAAASLGQVHRVTLKSGQLAVIKVQRPNLIRQFMMDLSILKRVARILQRNTELGRSREWVDIIDEFGRTLFEEVDYIQEGRNADQFRRNFAHMPHIRIPEIHWKYTSRRVIVMEYLPGTKVNDLATLEEAGFARNEISVNLVRSYFQQLLLDGFFHADPHPGNIVVNAEGQIVFYDFGMVGWIPDETRVQMINTFLNIVNKRPDAILKNLMDLGMIVPGADLDELRHLVEWALENYYNVPHDQLNFEHLADEMAEVMYYYPFRLPASFTFMFRALITLEGVATTLYPQIQFMGIAVEYAKDFVQRTYLMDRLFGPDAAKNYPSLIKEGLQLLGLPGKDRAVAGSSQRTRLYYDEWKPLARYVKAGFLLLAFGQTVLIVMGMALGLLFVTHLDSVTQVMVMIAMATFLMLYLLITFGTLLWMPARKKPVFFNPPKRQVSFGPNSKAEKARSSF